MSDNAIRLEIRGATLLAVPAVHFRLPFAEVVNAVCQNPSSRPDAIEVELGPAATAAARAWLQELGIGPERRRRLPCMLGLHRDHQLLYPAMREPALTHPLRATPGKPHPPSCHEALLGKALEHVYTRSPGASREQGGQDWRALGRFTHLLAADMQLTLRRFPNLGLVMRCAEAALPKPLSDALGRALTRFPWAKPAQFPDTEQLLDSREGKEGDVTLSGRGRPFRAGLVQGGAILVPNPGLVRITESHWQSHRGSDGSAWSSVLSWRPWERLATALSAQASGHVRKTQRVRVTESFTGQLLEGIDVRRTLRESARGQDRLMVRDSRLAPTRTPTSMTDAFPVVWIFDTGGPRHGEMTVLRTPLTWLLHAGRDRAALEERRDGMGEDMADLVLFAVRADERDAIARAWAEGRVQDALRRTDDLLASGGALTERETLTTLSRISGLIPECGWPMIPAGSYPYESILREVFERALRAGQNKLAGEVGLVLARAFEACGRFDGSSEVSRTLLTLARLRASRIEIAQYANNLGYALAQQSLWSEAERCCEEAVAGFTVIEAPGRAYNARANLLSARLDLYGFPDATSLESEIEEVDRYYPRASDWRQRKTLVLLARIREHVGDLDLALRLMEQALRVARKVKTRHRLEDAAYRRKLRDRIAREVDGLDEQVRVEGSAGLNRGPVR